MLDDTVTKNNFHEFKKQYAVILENCILDEDHFDIFVHEANKLGRMAIKEKINLLDVTSVHHSILVNLLGSVVSGNYIAMVEKAKLFFEEVITSFEMVSEEFREAIKLLNFSSIEFAMHIHDLKEEIMIRKQIESDLKANQEEYRILSERLQLSLNEKESLLQEVYHRVKNNLQVVVSLINLQLNTIQEEESKQALIKSSARVKSMALVHEMLYQSRNLSEINMDEYIAKLIQYLYEIYHINPKKIKYELKIESVSVGIDKAIPLGLIINEIISNSLKHAFPEDRSGEIHVTLKQKNEITTVIIYDNGIGIQVHSDPLARQSLGMRLIYNLSRQINAKVSLENNHGTQFVITIP